MNERTLAFTSEPILGFDLNTIPREETFNILAITAGEANGHYIRFHARVLKAALPLFDNLPVFLDHPPAEARPRCATWPGRCITPVGASSTRASC